MDRSGSVSGSEKGGARDGGVSAKTAGGSHAKAVGDLSVAVEKTSGSNDGVASDSGEHD